MSHFSSLAGVIAAGPERRRRILKSEDASLFLDNVQTMISTLLREEAFAGPLLGSAEALVDYLRHVMGFEPAEQLRVLYLDASNRLLSEQIASLGTLRETAIYPRELIRRALEVNASALLLAHNHPSGDTRPSEADLSATRRVVEAAKLLDIKVHDHVIVSSSGWTSFRALGLM